MSFHHLLQNKHEQIFLQAIDQHFENSEVNETEKSICKKENLEDMDHYEECGNIDVKFYFSFDEDEESNDVSTIDDSDDYDILVEQQACLNKKMSIASVFNLSIEDVKAEVSKIKNETCKESKMFQIKIQNKIKSMNQFYEFQMKNYINLLNSTNANNLNKANEANGTTSIEK